MKVIYIKINKNIGDSMNNYKLVAMIPARLGSKRIPKKNIRFMLGKPLIQYPIDLIRGNNSFESIWVNTESEELGKICEKLGVQFHRRPAELATDKATNREFVYEFLKKHECDYVVMVNPTSPALRAETVNAFVDYLRNGDYDTVLSVNSVKTETFVEGQPVNFDPGMKLPSQLLTPIKSVVWAMTAWKRDTFIKLQESGKCPVFGGKIGLFEIPEDECPDLDTEEDWTIAEAILKARCGQSDPIKYMEL